MGAPGCPQPGPRSRERQMNTDRTQQNLSAGFVLDRCLLLLRDTGCGQLVLPAGEAFLFPAMAHHDQIADTKDCDNCAYGTSNFG
jgi:hypothetical protein